MRLALQFLSERPRIVAPGLRVLAVGVEQQDCFGLDGCEADPRRDKHGRGQKDDNQPCSASKELAVHPSVPFPKKYYHFNAARQTTQIVLGVATYDNVFDRSSP